MDKPNTHEQQSDEQWPLARSAAFSFYSFCFVVDGLYYSRSHRSCGTSARGWRVRNIKHIAAAAATVAVTAYTSFCFAFQTTISRDLRCSS